MTLAQLQALMDSGEFHHATYRNRGTLWEGLWIYRKAPGHPRGFVGAGCFNAYMGNAELEQAFELCRGTGISVGSYGRG